MSAIKQSKGTSDLPNYIRHTNYFYNLTSHKILKVKHLSMRDKQVIYKDLRLMLTYFNTDKNPPPLRCVTSPLTV